MKPTIFDENFYRIYVPYRKYLVLEDILVHAGIEYWVDFDMLHPGSDTLRFYFSKNDTEAVELLLKEHAIQSTDDFNTVFDYQKDQKIFLIYIALFITLLIGSLIFTLYKLL